MIASSLQRVRRENEDELHRFLAQRPYENVLLDWLIAHDHSQATRERLFSYKEAEDAEITGVIHYGRQVMLSAQTAQTIRMLANAAYAYRHERMIVAEREVARAYWDAVKSWHAPPRLVRGRQPLLVIGRGELPQTKSALDVRLAEPEELEIVMENSAAMIEHELGYDPRRASSAFRWNVRKMIERGMWWVALDDGVLSFFCHVGPFSAHTIQLQGVWTPPARRRRGIARDALLHICQTLLVDYPTVSLYVNDFNIAALELYRGLGFRQCGELSTFLF